MSKILLSVLIIFLVSLTFGEDNNDGFELVLSYSCGFDNPSGANHYELTIGIREGATDGLDRGFDSPAPPVPPEICYASLMAPEGEPPFNILWKDIRGLGSLHEWQLHTIRNQGGGAISFDKSEIPENYDIFINGVNIAKSDDALITVQENDTVVYIYSIEGKSNKNCLIRKPVGIGGVTIIRLFDGETKMTTASPIMLEADSPIALFNADIASGFYRYEAVVEENDTLSGLVIVP